MKNLSFVLTIIAVAFLAFNNPITPEEKGLQIANCFVNTKSFRKVHMCRKTFSGKWQIERGLFSKGEAGFI